MYDTCLWLQTDVKTRAELKEIALAEADVAKLMQKVAEWVTTTKYTITNRCGVGTTGSSYKSVPRASSCKSVEGFV